jgi:uncharacterized protein
MALSMYDVSAPVFARTLGNLKGVLEKGAAHAQARKIDESAFLTARLFPDMFTLTQQVQVATDFARGTCARLSGAEPPSIDNAEKSFADLVSRVERSLDYVNSVPREAIDGSEGREIVRMMRGVEKKLTGANYLLLYALPNFYFHASMTYALLREGGVELGKPDFLGTFP